MVIDRIFENLLSDLEAEGEKMQVGDLVFMPYWEGYGTILKYNPSHDYDEETWRVVHPCGYISNEYTEDMEVVCK